MEPVLGGRDDLRYSMADAIALEAAMEPVLGGRDDAPPITDRPASVNRPQWSPSLADGTT